jgi:phosphate transport system permease protein
MSTIDPRLPGAQRTRLAAAGARSVTVSLTEGRGRDKVTGQIFYALLLLAVAFALAGLCAIVVQAFAKGSPALSLDLFTDPPSSSAERAGFRPALMGTLYLIAGVIVLVVPLGVGAALYLEEYADNTRWWNRLVELNIQNLAGVPSIIYGIFGLALFVRVLALGESLIAGALTVVLLILPIVIIASIEALRAVPNSQREGAYALGATRWQMVRGTVLPAAAPGLLTGIILAMARAIGEAAPLILVGAVTFVTFLPSPFQEGYTVLPIQVYQWANRPQDDFQGLAAAAIIVVLAVMLLLNGLALLLRARLSRNNQW